MAKVSAFERVQSQLDIARCRTCGGSGERDINKTISTTKEGALTTPAGKTPCSACVGSGFRPHHELRVVRLEAQQ